ncbi:hypothetical protein LUZ60_010197 [Juncus effusus]|nr:hypothetical protein LUZ60_010197 [Juncus effusus]
MASVLQTSPLRPLQLQKELPLKSSFWTPTLSSSTSSSTRRIKSLTITCRITKSKPSLSTNQHSSSLAKEAHKYFDHASITVRAGDGGHGAVLDLPKPPTETPKTLKSKSRNKNKKIPPSFKRDSDGSLILPMGGHGGDVVIYADESLETLLEFHSKSRYCAKRGGNVDAMGELNSRISDGFPAPVLRIPVPVGTVVKRKKGKVIADLARPGDEILVARGGQGGISLLEMPEGQRRKMMSLSTNVMRDPSDKVLVLGQPGEEVSLELVLRVVADVGLVGLPNAGKSTLLASLTLAKPDIADYPFTTLMPNLGRLGGDPALGALQFSTEATLADLPGLIEGAHLGKGLGRNFLRHLRRTRLLVHVVDASALDPLKDYKTVREELRMYNPNYLERPYVVVLNKIDLPEACERLALLIQEISTIGCGESTDFDSSKDSQIEKSEEETKERLLEDYPRPFAVVATSLLNRIGIDEMLTEIRAGLRKCMDLEKLLGQ